MIYWKSILSGLGVAAVVAAFGGVWAQGLQYRAALSEGIVAFHWHRGVVVLGLLASFAIGFWWRYRKGS